MASIRLFRDSNFRGGEIQLSGDFAALSALNFNDTLTSVIVESGTWTLFADSNFRGFSVTVSAHGGPLGDGRYPNSGTIGNQNDNYSSVRLNSEIG
jgi:hypothetical protein